MSITAFLFDVTPVGGGIGIVAGIAFFLVFAAAAFIAYKILKKSVKMAFRMVIVAIILLLKNDSGVEICEGHYHQEV